MLKYIIEPNNDRYDLTVYNQEAGKKSFGTFATIREAESQAMAEHKFYIYPGLQHTTDHTKNLHSPHPVSRMMRIILDLAKCEYMHELVPVAEAFLKELSLDFNFIESYRHKVKEAHYFISVLVPTMKGGGQ